MGTIDVQATIGQIVREQPNRSRVLEKLGIDYCCGGSKLLDQACREKGLDPDAVAQSLQTIEQTEADADVSAMTMTQLVDHIEQTHHVYLKQELPRLVALTQKIAKVHGAKSVSLGELTQVVSALTEELSSHMEKEEQILFPSLRELDTTGKIAHACFGTVRGPIQMMEHEHDIAGQALTRIRDLTENYTLPEWGCNTYLATLQGLAALESDLHQHIHKENNILFPMAVEAENAAAGV